MAGIKFDVMLDTRHFTDGMKKIRNSVNQTSAEIKKSGLSLEQYFQNLKSAAAAVAAGFSAKQFISQMVQVRGQFQQLEVAFKTMLGSEEKAAALMEQITRTAATTPFDLQGVASGAKQLLAYGIEAEKVNNTLIHLGDIAAGLSLPLNDLVYLYGTTMTQGRMFTQDLRQFQGRGIPIAEELAKQFGVTKDKVGELVTAGEVGAKEFNQAIMAMSSESGKFAGLMEAQSKTITGQISNIEDAIDSMFNDLGKQSEGIINGTLSVVSSLVENYQKVGEVIGSVVATYGVYKAAVMTVTAIQALQTAGVGALTAAETVHYGWLVLCEKAQKMLNATMLANPYVLAATAIAGLVAIMVTMKSQQDLVNEAQDEYNRKKEETIANEQKHMDKLNELIRIAGDESLSTDTRKEAMMKLKAKYPELFKKYNTEIEALKDIAYWKAKIAEIESGKSITLAKNELEDVNRQITELEARAKANREEYMKLTPQERRYATASLTREEAAMLTQLRNRRDELNKEQKKVADAAYMKDLTGISNEDLEKQINERRNLIARMEMQEKEGKKNVKGHVLQGGVTGLYDNSELQDQLQTMEWEQNRRKKALEDSTKDFVAEAEKAYKKEQAALKKLESLTDPIKRSKSKQTIDGKKVSEMDSDEFLAAIEKQQKAVEEAKKKVDAYNKAKNGGSTSKGSGKAEADRTKKVFEQELSERERQSQQLEALKDAQSSAAIAKEQNRVKRELLQAEKDHQDRLTAIERQAEEMRKANYEAQKKAWETANTDKTKSWADTNTAKDVAANGYKNIQLTKEQMDTLKALREKENADYANFVKERFDAERQSMIDYLKEYGTYQQQRLAIAEEYAEKIAKAEVTGNKWEAKRLTSERDSRIAQANAQSIAMNIDWNQTFLGIGNVLQDIAKETLDKVNDYMGTAEFKALDASAKKAYADLRQTLIDAGGQKASNPFSSKTWDEIAELTEQYKFHVKALADASETETAAITEHQKAMDKEKQARADLEAAIKAQAKHFGKADQGEYDKAVENARQNLADATQGVADTFQQMQESGEAVQQQQTNVSNTQQNLHQKTDAAAQGLNNFQTVVSQITSGSLKGFADGISNIIMAITGSKNQMEGVAGIFGETGKQIGGIVGAILSIIDMLGDKPVEFFDNLFDGISKVFEAFISHIPEIIMSVIKGVGNIVGSVFKGIGGLLGFGGADNSEEQLAKQDEIRSVIETATHSIDKLTEALEKSYGAEAMKTAQQLEEKYKSQAASQIAGLDAALWSNYGGGHSDYWHWNKNTGDIARQIAQKYGLNFTGDWNSLFNNNDAEKVAEAIRDIRDNEAEWWRILTTQGYNEGAVKEWLDSLISTADAMDAAREQLKEQLTTTTADDVFDNFLSSLYDLADGVEDVTENIAEDWQKMVNRMVVNNVIGGKMREDLEAWYKQLVELQQERSDGTIGNDE